MSFSCEFSARIFFWGTLSEFFFPLFITVKCTLMIGRV